MLCLSGLYSRWVPRISYERKVVFFAFVFGLTVLNDLEMFHIKNKLFNILCFFFNTPQTFRDAKHVQNPLKKTKLTKLKGVTLAISVHFF